MGYTLLLSLIEYKTLVMRGDLDRANEVLPSIPKEHHNRYLQPSTSGIMFMDQVFASNI